MTSTPPLLQLGKTSVSKKVIKPAPKGKDKGKEDTTQQQQCDVIPSSSVMNLPPSISAVNTAFIPQSSISSTGLFLRAQDKSVSTPWFSVPYISQLMPTKSSSFAIDPNLACWWDRDLVPVNHQVWSIPLGRKALQMGEPMMNPNCVGVDVPFIACSYSSTEMRFDGYFCSRECRRAWVLDNLFNSTYASSLAYINMEDGPNPRVARHWRTLRTFGGELDITSFRTSSAMNGEMHVITPFQHVTDIQNSGMFVTTYSEYQYII